MTHAVATKAESKSAPPEAKRAEPRSGPAAAPLGVPLYLQAVQHKCACGGTCAACGQQEETIVQHKCSCGGTCPECAGRARGAEADDELQPKEDSSITPAHEPNEPHRDVRAIARSGVETAHAPLPHLDRIQASFGRHDVRGAKAQVGGAAAGANERMGSAGYTVGDRVGFRSSPDLKLAAHEATHVVHQRRGVHLADGVGHPGDAYEQHADEVADVVARGESAEPILDRGPAGRAAAPAAFDEPVQHQLAINATRLFETGPRSSETGAGGGSGGRRGGDGARPAAEGTAPAAAEGGAEDTDRAAEGDEAAASADAGSGEGGGGGGGAEGAPPAGGIETAGAGAPPCTGTPEPTCYREPSEEPDPEPEEQPENPPANDVEAETSDAGEEDAPEPDDCPPPGAMTAAGPGGTGAAAPGAPAPPPGGGAPAATAPAAAASTSAVATAEPAMATERGGGDAGASAGAGGGGGAGAGGGGGGGGGGGAAGGSAATLSPIDESIATVEGGRATAVAAYASSSAALGAAYDTSAALRGGVHFAGTDGTPLESAARTTATARANLFFAQAADHLDAVIDFAMHDAPDQLGAQAEAAKAQIASSIEAQKSAISERIEQARGAARTAAAIARQEVMLQAEAFVADVEAQTAAAIEGLTATHTDTMGQVDDLETATLDGVNDIYAQGRTDLEGLGTTIGGECVTVGESYATRYAGFRHCTENGFWDGDLSERRSMAQEKAAREEGQAYNERLTEAARKRAREVTRAGRKEDRCAVIASATNARDTLDQTLTALVGALESARETTIQQAGAARDSIIASIDGSLSSTLGQLDQQEYSQRQAANDAGYTQQVTQEMIAFAASASIQQSVAAAATAAQEVLRAAQAQLTAAAPPDPALLDAALVEITQRLSSALAGLRSTVDGGVSLSAEQLAAAAAQGLAALDGVTAGNDEMAGAVSDGFAVSMAAIAGRDNFADQRAGFTDLVQQTSDQGSEAMAQAYEGMADGCDQTMTGAEDKLATAYDGLEQNLRQSRASLECDIVRKADEAASHEAPAWKMLVAILLVIIVIVIVIAVTIATAGGALAGLGVLATIAAGAAIGAVVGAVTSGLLAIASNLWNNRSWTQGVGQAILIGAITGAIGGGIGAAAGAGVGAIFSASTKAVQVGAQFVTAMVTAGGMDVVTQYVMGGMSWDHFSGGQLGLTLLITALTFGLGHYAGARATAPRAPGGATPEPAVPGAHPTEAVPAAHPTEPVPAARPTEPVAAAHPTEPVPSAHPAEPAPAAHPTEPTPTAAHPSETPAPAAHPEELPAAPGARPEERIAPAGAAEPETPVAPAEAGAPEPAAPRTPEEASLLENTASKPSEELSPSEATTERAIADRGEGRPIDEPPFTIERDLPNGHKIKETSDGEFFERCSNGCAVFDSDGRPRRMRTVTAEEPTPEHPEGWFEQPEAPAPEVERVGPGRRTGVEPEASATPEPLEPIAEHEAPTRFEDLPEHLEETGAPTREQEQMESRAAADETESTRPDLRTSESTSGPERARAAAERAERTPPPTPDDSDVITVPDEPPPGSPFEEPPEFVNPENARRAYMGETPSKYSDVGADVVARMRAEVPPRIRGTGDLLPGNPNNLEVLGPDGNWYRIDETIDMAHNSPDDAVNWWNDTGRFYGPRSPEVIEWMNNPDNYTLMPMGPNRSAGARLGVTYLPPE
jgi:hypothetical protein